MTTITSTSNQRVKGWVALSKRSERDRTGTFFVEGRREVERMSTRAELLELVLRDDVGAGAVAVDPPSPPVRVGDHVFSRVSRRQNPDGIAAVFSTPRHDLESIDLREDALVLVADGIEKPGNIGAMLRTADALGAMFVGSTLGTDLVNPNVIRSAQGSLFATPTASARRDRVIAWCRENLQSVVLRPMDSVSVWSVDMTVPTAIVVGAEDRGVDPLWADVGIGTTIPMVGSADSLNASVAAAIVLAEAVRQRSAPVSMT